MNCCGTTHYDNNPCVPFADIAPRDGLVVEKCGECRDGYCYNMDDTSDCYWCGKLVLMDGDDNCVYDGMDFCAGCGKLYDRIYDEDEDKQFKLVIKEIKQKFGFTTMKEEEERVAAETWAHWKAMNM